MELPLIIAGLVFVDQYERFEGTRNSMPSCTLPRGADKAEKRFSTAVVREVGQVEAQVPGRGQCCLQFERVPGTSQPRTTEDAWYPLLSNASTEY